MRTHSLPIACSFVAPFEQSLAFTERRWRNGGNPKSPNLAFCKLKLNAFAVDLLLEAPDSNESPPLSVSVSGKRTSLRHCRSLFPGNGILRGRGTGLEKGRHIQPLVSRDNAPTQKLRQFGPICTTSGNFCSRGTAWWGWEIYDNCDPPMIWLSGAAYFSTLNVKRNFQYAPHCADGPV